MSKTKLKPCPFCGYSNAVAGIEKHVFCGKVGYVKCDICGAEVGGVGVLIGTTTDALLKQSAITAWNTRHAPRAKGSRK